MGGCGSKTGAVENDGPDRPMPAKLVRAARRSNSGTPVDAVQPEPANVTSNGQSEAANVSCDYEVIEAEEAVGYKTAENQEGTGLENKHTDDKKQTEISESENGKKLDEEQVLGSVRKTNPSDRSENLEECKQDEKLTEATGSKKEVEDEINNSKKSLTEEFKQLSVSDVAVGSEEKSDIDSCKVEEALPEDQENQEKGNKEEENQTEERDVVEGECFKVELEPHGYYSNAPGLSTSSYIDVSADSSYNTCISPSKASDEDDPFETTDSQNVETDENAEETVSLGSGECIKVDLSPTGLYCKAPGLRIGSYIDVSDGTSDGEHSHKEDGEVTEDLPQSHENLNEDMKESVFCNEEGCCEKVEQVKIIVDEMSMEPEEDVEVEQVVDLPQCTSVDLKPVSLAEMAPGLLSDSLIDASAELSDYTPDTTSESLDDSSCNIPVKKARACTDLSDSNIPVKKSRISTDIIEDKYEEYHEFQAPASCLSAINESDEIVSDTEVSKITENMSENKSKSDLEVYLSGSKISPIPESDLTNTKISPIPNSKSPSINDGESPRVSPIIGSENDISDNTSKEILDVKDGDDVDEDRSEELKLSSDEEEIIDRSDLYAVKLDNTHGVTDSQINYDMISGSSNEEDNDVNESKEMEESVTSSEGSVELAEDSGNTDMSGMAEYYEGVTEPGAEFYNEENLSFNKESPGDIDGVVNEIGKLQIDHQRKKSPTKSPEREPLVPLCQNSNEVRDTESLVPLSQTSNEVKVTDKKIKVGINKMMNIVLYISDCLLQKVSKRDIVNRCIQNYSKKDIKNARQKAASCLEFSQMEKIAPKVPQESDLTRKMVQELITWIQEMDLVSKLQKSSERKCCKNPETEEKAWERLHTAVENRMKVNMMSIQQDCTPKGKRSKRKSTAKSKEKKQLRKLENAKLKASKAVVDAANELPDPMSQLSPFRVYDRNGLNVDIECSKVANLDKATLDWAFDITKQNMQALYEQSDWGWDDKQKREEMSEDAAWYLIARQTDTLQPVACVHFRFDLDEGEEVLYCYEIQLAKEVRRKGLGKFLMQILELMAFKTSMKKVMCTIFKHNQQAQTFFKKKLKYERDETSPEETMVEAMFDEDRYTYEIVSKTIAPKKASPVSSPPGVSMATTSTSGGVNGHSPTVKAAS